MQLQICNCICNFVCSSDSVPLLINKGEDGIILIVIFLLNGWSIVVCFDDLG